MGFVGPATGQWFVGFEFDDVGYVRDDEKSSLNADSLLESIKRGTEAANQERMKKGWPTLAIIGEAEGLSALCGIAHTVAHGAHFEVLDAAPGEDKGYQVEGIERGERRARADGRGGAVGDELAVPRPPGPARGADATFSIGRG